MESLITFTVAKHDTTSTNDALDFSIFWTRSMKQPEMIANVLNRVRSENFQNKGFKTTVGLSIDMKYECEAGYTWSILGKLG